MLDAALLQSPSTPSYVLKYVEVPIVPKNLCEEFLRVRIKPGMICAGWDEGVRDACYVGIPTETEVLIDFYGCVDVSGRLGRWPHLRRTDDRNRVVWQELRGTEITYGLRGRLLLLQVDRKNLGWWKEVEKWFFNPHHGVHVQCYKICINGWFFIIVV